MSNYSSKDVIFQNLNVTTNAFTNNTPKITQQYEIKLVQGQNITYARVFATCDVSGHALGVAARLLLNGVLLQIFNFDPFNTTQQTFQLDITNELLANNLNSFEFDFDGSLQDVTFTVYADVFFSLNTTTGPSSQGNKGNPSTSIIAALQQIEVPLIIGGVVLGGIYVVSKIFK